MLRRSKKAKPSPEKKPTDTRPVKAEGANKEDVPKQERPRICLIDVQDDLAEVLEGRGLNCYRGTFGPMVDVPNTSKHSSHQCLPNLDFPPNLHEYDIVIVDLQTPKRTSYVAEDHTKTKIKGQKQFCFISSFPETVFDPRPLSASVLESRIKPLMGKDSILVVFTAPQEKVIYQPVSISAKGPIRHRQEEHSLYNFYSDLPRWENISGKDTTVSGPEGADITYLLKKHNNDAIYTIAFSHPTYWKDDERIKSKNFLPLMTASAERVIAFAQSREKNWAFFFPRIKDKQSFLCDLLEKVLPGIIPPVFPYSTQFAWLADPRYRLPNEEELLAQRDRLKKEYQSKLDAIELRIDANRQEHGFLHDLLTKSGVDLVKTVERLLRWLEFDEVVNVDETNPEIQEEDLRVKTDSGLLVIEVKGIGGTSTDSECSQISKIKYRRSKERNSFDVFGLYCVNHQRYLPPENRQNPPFNPRQIQDAKNDERGLLTTYELFKLYFNIKQGLVSKDNARRAMLGIGLVTFPPTGAHQIPEPFDLHHNGLVVVCEIQGIELRPGLQVILDHDGWYSSATIQEIQVDGRTVETAVSGKVGIKMSAPVPKSCRLWVKVKPREEWHPTTDSNVTSG
jgi:hypothetical protein